MYNYAYYPEMFLFDMCTGVEDTMSYNYNYYDNNDNDGNDNAKHGYVSVDMPEDYNRMYLKRIDGSISFQGKFRMPDSNGDRSASMTHDPSEGFTTSGNPKEYVLTIKPDGTGKFFLEDPGARADKSSQTTVAAAESFEFQNHFAF